MKKVILLVLLVFIASSITFGQKKRTSKKQVVKKPSVSKPTPSEVTWQTYTKKTQNGTASIKFPVTPNQDGDKRFAVDFKESELALNVSFFAKYQSVYEEGFIALDLLQPNYGKTVFNDLQSERPQIKAILISYKNLKQGTDEIKFTFVDSDGRTIYNRVRFIMRDRTLFSLTCKRIGSFDDTLCDKFYNSFSFKYSSANWKTFYGDGFNILMPAKVEKKKFSVYIPQTGKTGNGINYSAIEKETYFNIGVSPNGFTVAFPPSVKTADANAAVMLKEIPGPNGICARYLNEGIKCRIDFIKSTQVDDTFLLEFHIYVNNKAVGYIRGFSTPSRTYLLSVVNLEKYEQSTLEKFFNSFKLTIK